MFDVQSLLRRRELALGLIVLLLILAVGARTPAFLTPGSLVELLTDTSILIILAIGQMTVILARCIDLSVAANVALTGMITALLSAHMPELPIAVTIAVALATGLALGAVNGFLVAAIGIPPIVITLGTLSIYRGTVFLLTGGAWVNSNEMSRAFLDFPRQVLFGLPMLAWIAIVIAICAWYVLNHTRFGREIYAAGGNPRAAVYAGIRINRIQFLVFCISGLLAGLCGYLWVSRYAVAYVEIAMGFELQVIAACVIGGVSIAGGIGSVAGAVLGALFLGVVKNALPIINISPFWQMGISGAVIVAAVVINSRGERKAGRLILKEASIAAARGRQGAGA
jgi:rhamnose transport system permease protein